MKKFLKLLADYAVDGFMIGGGVIGILMGIQCIHHDFDKYFRSVEKEKIIKEVTENLVD